MKKISGFRFTASIFRLFLEISGSKPQFSGSEPQFFKIKLEARN